VSSPKSQTEIDTFGSAGFSFVNFWWAIYPSVVEKQLAVTNDRKYLSAVGNQIYQRSENSPFVGQICGRRCGWMKRKLAPKNAFKITTFRESGVSGFRPSLDHQQRLASSLHTGTTKTPSFTSSNGNSKPAIKRKIYSNINKTICKRAHLQIASSPALGAQFKMHNAKIDWRYRLLMHFHYGGKKIKEKWEKNEGEEE
jgi:hypothetical protein